MRSGAIPMTLGGKPYVAVPEAEYRLLIGEADPLAGTVAGSLKAARLAAGLTQATIAERLGVGAAHVSNCEAGRERVGAKLRARWLKACRLPADWMPPHTG